MSGCKVSEHLCRKADRMSQTCDNVPHHTNTPGQPAKSRHMTVSTGRAGNLFRVGIQLASGDFVLTNRLQISQPPQDAHGRRLQKLFAIFGPGGGATLSSVILGYNML
ncbi:hypothetical protein NDU88_004154 [Pleurodeles waltl]|uniref:Uncharacterized protein n=1 Tax=Pleurodeles waltl TaxID=8319 RepID=A0AAV7V0F0_PLEWA|nr:hypothetical protein NDU88_004154 [Pleurodeles waltl]